MNDLYDEAMREGREDEAAAEIAEYDPATDGRNDLLMMKRADLWPVWPMLPVKKPRWKTGFLAEEGSTKIARPTVYDYRNPRETIASYSSLEELIEDGWVVD